MPASQKASGKRGSSSNPKAPASFWQRCTSLPGRAEAAFDQVLSRFSNSLPRSAKRVLGPILAWLGDEEPGSPVKAVRRKVGGRAGAKPPAGRSYSDAPPKPASGKRHSAAVAEPQSTTGLVKLKRAWGALVARFSKRKAVPPDEAAAREAAGRADPKRRGRRFDSDEPAEEPRATTPLAKLRLAFRSFLARFSKKKATDDADADEGFDSALGPRRRGSRAEGARSGARERGAEGDGQDQSKAAVPRRRVCASVRYLALAFVAAGLGFGFRWVMEPSVPEAKAYKKALRKVETTQEKLKALKTRQAKAVKDLKRELAQKNKAMAAAAKARAAALEGELAAAREEKLAAVRRVQEGRQAPALKSANCLLSGDAASSAKALRDCVMEFNRTGS